MTNQPTNRPDKPQRASEAQHANAPGSRPNRQPSEDQRANLPSDRPVRRESSDFFAQKQAETSNQEVLIRKRKRSNSKRKKRLRVAAIVVAVIALIGGGTAFGIMSTIKAGENAVRDANTAQNILTNEQAVAYDEGKTVKYNGHTYALNEEMVSVAIIGFDRAAPAEPGEPAGQSDAIVVMVFNQETGKLSTIAVPRDSMVEVGEFIGSAFKGLTQMQICLSYAYGDGGKTSCEYTTAALSRALYNMPISYYFALDLSGVGPLNDAIGGVALTPLRSIPGTNIIEGQNVVLFGDNALRYVQWRDTSVLDSSLDRQARQVQYIKAFASQTLQASQGSVGTMLELFNTASQYSISNLGINEFSYLATSVIQSGVTDLDVVTLPGEIKQGEKYAEYYLDKKAVYETVLSVYYHQVD